MDMKALVLSAGRLQVKMVPVPEINKGEALIQMIKAGICQTDLELQKGYMDFEGIPGHEFVGRIVKTEKKEWLGKRVVGEINCACRECDFCRNGRKNHCQHRSVLGIRNRDGAFAEFLSLPLENLHPVPDNISDSEAVFIEPLAAALRIPQQIRIKREDRVLVMGDGRLGLLASQVMRLRTQHVWCLGKHDKKLSFLKSKGIHTWKWNEGRDSKCFDVIIEATGDPESLEFALQRLNPQGCLILKSTTWEQSVLNVSKIVVDEFHLIGSRCGPFSEAIKVLKKNEVEVEELVDKVFPLEQGVEAFLFANEPGKVKVLLSP